MSFVEEFGNKLRDLREAKGWSLEELARRCEVTKGYISKIERGDAIPSVRLLEKITQPLGTQLAFRGQAQIMSQVGITDLFENEGAAKNKLQADILAAKEIRVLLVRGWSALGRRGILLREILEEKSDGRIRIMLLNPRSSYVKIVGKQFGYYPPGSLSDGITQAVRSLQDIEKRTGATIEWRFYDDFPIWRLFFADDKLYVGSYLEFFKRETDSSSVHYRIVRKEPPSESLYLAFENYFEHLWNRRARRRSKRLKAKRFLEGKSPMTASSVKARLGVFPGRLDFSLNPTPLC